MPHHRKVSGPSYHQHLRQCAPMSKFIGVSLFAGKESLCNTTESDGVWIFRYDKRGIGYQPAGDTRHSRIPESNEDWALFWGDRCCLRNSLEPRQTAMKWCEYLCAMYSYLMYFNVLYLDVLNAFKFMKAILSLRARHLGSWLQWSH